MTSEFNKKLPILAPKPVIGIKRRPNLRDLRNRDGLRGLPDPDPLIVLQRTGLENRQAALRIEEVAIGINNESSIRDSLTVRAEREARWSDSEWETVTDVSSEMDEEDERGLEDAFIAKVGGAEVGEVTAARGRRDVGVDMPAFVRKVRAVQRRPTVAAGGAEMPAPAPSESVPAPAPVPTNMQPGKTRELTTAQAALALTNAQAGTNVTIDDLRTVRAIEDNEDTLPWIVGNVDTRELTVAEAALLLTNVQAGTNVAMQDLRTAREMVDLWDDEDIYEWTVGNVE